MPTVKRARRTAVGKAAIANRSKGAARRLPNTKPRKKRTKSA